MQATFHWLRIETFCYATEKEDLVSETFRQIAGTDENDFRNHEFFLYCYWPPWGGGFRRKPGGGVTL